jgi:hypothetical protein
LEQLQSLGGGDQRAKDGGVDVRVDIPPSSVVSGYIPQSVTAYQVKAEKFEPSKIPGEMAPKGKLRPAIVELSKNSGAYIIVSTVDNCSDSFLISRKQAMSKCLEEHGLTEHLELDFYDSRRIADWAGNHPGVLVWLRDVLRRPIQGWKPYGPWAYQGISIDDEYLLDDKIKVFVPNTDEAISVIDALKRLRAELATPRTSARIVGLSGVGKTRLVQALFGIRIESSSALDRENVLYTDLSDDPHPQPTAMLEALIQDESNCVVVIDNCGQNVHAKLTEIVQRPESKIRLVTVEYDIREDLPTGTACYRLEGSSDEVIAKLLKRHYQMLSDLDVHKIVEFSAGNARVAFALASTSSMKGQLAQLRDDDLFRRLFIQKQSESDELLRCAKAASLVYSFDAEDDSETSELAVLAAVGEVSITAFLRNVAELKRRGLIQARGKWRAVLPHAIANRLAMRCLEDFSPQFLIKKLISETSERIARSFSRRLGYLHESEVAAAIVSEWLKPRGLLGDATRLNELEWQMLENIAPVNESAALDTLLRATENEELISHSNEKRAEFTRLLRSLAYEANLFERAVSALLIFALAEPEEGCSNSGRKILKSLFYSHFSGTLASPKQRTEFVNALILSNDDAKLKLAISLLQAGLEAYHFSSSFSFDFGARKRSYGWYPRTLDDFRNWYGAFVQLAAQIGKSDTLVGLDARGILGRAIRGLWGDEWLNKKLIEVTQELAAVDGWPDGWIGIRNALRWEKEAINGKSLEQLKMLEKQLAPCDLWGKIQAKILRRGDYSVELDGEYEDEPDHNSGLGWYERISEEAEILGKTAATDETVLSDLRPFLFHSGHTNKPYCFGIGVGKEHSAVGALINQIHAIIDSNPNRAFDLQFVHGLLVGWHSVKPLEVAVFMDSAVADSVWGAHFPMLQLSMPLDDVAYCRLIKSLEIGLAPSWCYAQLSFGRRSDTLSVKQLSVLLNLLKSKPDNGTEAAIDIIYMVIHCAADKDANYRQELQAYVSGFVVEIDWARLSFKNHSFDYHLEKVIEFALSGNDPYKITKLSIERLLEQECFNFMMRCGDLLRPFFKENPIDALDGVYCNDEVSSMQRLLILQTGRNDETALADVPTNAIIEWCKGSPDERCKFAAEGCKLFEWQNTNDPNNENVLSISADAISLLEIAPDKHKILEILVRRFSPSHWSGSRAAIMRQRLPLIDQLNPLDDPELSNLISAEKMRLSDAISSEERWELELERRETGSFE